MTRRDLMCFVVGAVVSWLLLGLLFQMCRRPAEATQAPVTITHSDTVTVVRVDTVRKFMPIARDSAVVRYVAVETPRPAETDASRQVEADSGVAVLPIEQKHYVDTAYEAWVSGYKPRLDSIRVYNKTETHTATTTHTVKVPDRRRWGLGVTAGYGYTPAGFQPWIGVGITYTIASF